jgi:glycine cleavage system transcriptional repressor
MLGAVRRFALAAVGGDRPGIVAEIARVLLEHELNIEDSQMAILRGRFCMLLILAGADGVREEPLRAAIERVGRELGLDAVALSALGEPAGAAQAGSQAAGADAPSLAQSGQALYGPSCIITVYGADHPGIVHAVAAKLASAQINITDLQTQLVAVEEPAPPAAGTGAERARSQGAGEELEHQAGGALYAMIIECDLPAGMGVEAVEQLLGNLRAEQSVDLTVRELERDVL